MKSNKWEIRNKIVRLGLGYGNAECGMQAENGISDILM